MRDQYHEQDSLGDINKHSQYLPRGQVERVIPSIEGSFQDGRHLQDVFDVSGEQSSKTSHASAGFSHDKKPRQQIIKLNEREVSTSKNRMHDKLVLLPSERARPFPREYRRQKSILVPLKSHDEWPDSLQRHGPPMYISHMSAFPREDRALYLHPVNATQKPENNRATQMLEGPTDYADQNQMIDHGQARYIYHEPSQIPTKSTNLRQQHHIDSRHVNNLVEFSPQFPNFCGVYDNLPISRVPLKLQETNHCIDFNRTRKVTYSTTDESDMRGFDELDNGLGPNVKDFDDSPAHQHHNARQIRGDGNNQITYLPSDDSAQADVHEKFRTGVFLRKIEDGQKIVSDNTEPWTENRRVRYELERLPTTQRYEKIVSRHSDLKSKQAQLAGAETYTGNLTQSLPRSDDNQRYVAFKLLFEIFPIEQFNLT